MLVIRRRPGQSVVVGDDIEIEVVEVATNRVTLGVTAPKHIAVVRKEIHLTGEVNRAATRGIAKEALEALRERFRRGEETRNR